jgi:hypothetical protein
MFGRGARKDAPKDQSIMQMRLNSCIMIMDTAFKCKGKKYVCG